MGRNLIWCSTRCFNTDTSPKVPKIPLSDLQEFATKYFKFDYEKEIIKQTDANGTLRIFDKQPSQGYVPVLDMGVYALSQRPNVGRTILGLVYLGVYYTYCVHFN